jgi:hypothetical protein
VEYFAARHSPAGAAAAQGAGAGFLQDNRVTTRLRALALACFPLALSLSTSEHRRLDAGESVVRILSANGPSVGVRAAARADVTPRRLVEWARQVQRLQTLPYQSVAGRFSDPPRIEDVAGLDLDDEDLTDLRQCRPTDCDLKLEDDEIEQVRRRTFSAGHAWKPALQAAFRHIVLARAQRYLIEGHNGASYHDRRTPVLLAREFSELAHEAAAAQPRVSSLIDYLTRFPHGAAPDVESFLYWSKDSLGARPIVGVTHVAILESRDPAVAEAVVARKQVYASHYVNGSLSITAVTLAAGDSDRYLVYINHTRADVFDGLFGGLIRKTIERRLRREGPRALDALRRQLESDGS